MSQTYAQQWAKATAEYHPQSRAVASVDERELPYWKLHQFANEHNLDRERCEVFIELDRNLAEEAETMDLLPYLHPAVLRIDEFGDLIIHVTTADRLDSLAETEVAP